MDLLFLDTNGLGLGGLSHAAAISKHGAGQVDFLFLDSLYKVLPVKKVFFRISINALLQPTYVEDSLEIRVCYFQIPNA